MVVDEVRVMWMVWWRCVEFEVRCMLGGGSERAAFGDKRSRSCSRMQVYANVALR